MDADAAQVLGDALWADYVEASLHREPTHVDEVSSEGELFHSCHDADGFEETESVHKDGIFLLRFGSAPSGGNSADLFRKQLVEGPQLKPYMEGLEAAGYQWQTAEGALICVTPAQYQDVLQSLKMHELHPFHIVISESLEYLLDEVLSSIAFKKRPLVKDGIKGRFQLDMRATQGTDHTSDVLGTNNANHSLAFQEEALAEIIVERTFLSIKPVVRDAQSVTQSSAAAHGAPNPRCFYAFCP